MLRGDVVLATKCDKVFIVNSDDTDIMRSLSCKEAYVITYGLCNKATLTASSIGQHHIVLCLQRAITTLEGKTIEPQEFTISLSREFNPETVMLIAAVCLTSGVSASALSKFMF